MESSHKSGRFTLLPLLVRGEAWPAGGAELNQFLQMRAPSSPSSLHFIKKHLFSLGFIVKGVLACGPTVCHGLCTRHLHDSHGGASVRHGNCFLTVVNHSEQKTGRCRHPWVPMLIVLAPSPPPISGTTYHRWKLLPLSLNYPSPPLHNPQPPSLCCLCGFDPWAPGRSGIVQCLFLCTRRVLQVRSIHVVACDRLSFLFEAE